MIDIYNMAHGWAMLQIGQCHFCVSYLSDVRDEIDYLLDLNMDDYYTSCSRIYLEGENAGDLTLIAYLTYEADNTYINIIWRPMFNEHGENTIIMKYDYSKFRDSWEMVKDKIKDEYETNFLMEERCEE